MGEMTDAVVNEQGVRFDAKNQMLYLPGAFGGRIELGSPVGSACREVARAQVQQGITPTYDPDWQYERRESDNRARMSSAETDALNFGPPAEEDDYSGYRPEGSTAAAVSGLAWLLGIPAALGVLVAAVVAVVNIMLPLADEVLKSAR